MPLPRIDLDVDLKVLLAQHRPSTTQNDATTGEDTILVAIVLSVPQSVDEDIAKQYGLELLDRTELPELDLRIVQFRVVRQQGDRAASFGTAQRPAHPQGATERPVQRAFAEHVRRLGSAA